MSPLRALLALRLVTELSELPDVLRVEEVARVIRCGRNAAYALVASGAIRSVRVGQRGIRVTKAALLEFLENGDAAHQDDASLHPTPIRQEGRGQRGG